MTIHREGYRTIALVGAAMVILNWAAFSFISENASAVKWIILTASVLFWGFIVSFFRVPKRSLTAGDDLVVCPADGKVVVIEEVVDTEYFKDKRLQISVFMSPANVHQNRNPVSGEVVYNQYHKGKYLVAWDPKSSTENERHSIVIRNKNGDTLVKQIAGALAKRIVNYTSVGQQVQQSDEYGFIKFGSRVDVLLPLDAKIEVALNQKVKGGVTILARFDRKK
jgi:phosphatidylserine decarboxylase